MEGGSQGWIRNFLKGAESGRRKILQWGPGASPGRGLMDVYNKYLVPQKLMQNVTICNVFMYKI